MLSWAAEAAQVDISAGLALAVLALLAVLPEYAVDFVFSFQAGQIYAAEGTCPPAEDGSTPCALALANMTGANRVLVGVGWPLVVAVATLAVWHSRRHGGGDSATHAPGLRPDAAGALGGGRLPRHRHAVLADAAAAAHAHARRRRGPRRDLLRLRVAAVEGARRGAGPAGHVGVGRRHGDRRRAGSTFSALFLVAALVILACAEHFAEGLVQTGEGLGVDPFILVQWVAPLASEAPELIVACLFAWRLKAADSLGHPAVEQGQPVDAAGRARSRSSSRSPRAPRTACRSTPSSASSCCSTAAQSLFAVSILITLALTTRGAAALFVLFAVQFFGSLLLDAEADRILNLALSGRLRRAGRRPARPAPAPARPHGARRARHPVRRARGGRRGDVPGPSPGPACRRPGVRMRPPTRKRVPGR